MHFSPIKGRSLPRSATGTISKGAQLALLLCGFLGIASVLLISSGTMASPNSTASNPDEPSRGQVRRKAPQAMVRIPGSAFLMGTNEWYDAVAFSQWAGQTAAHGSRVGIRRPRRLGIKEVRLG